MKLKIPGFTLRFEPNAAGDKLKTNFFTGPAPGSTLYIKEDDDFYVLLQCSAYPNEEEFSRNFSTEWLGNIFSHSAELKNIPNVFAFIAWNKSTNQLLAAVDKQGVQPLYYALEKNGAIYFASHIPLFVNNSPTLSVNPDGLLSHFGFGYQVSPFPFLYNEVQRVQAGEVLEIHKGGIRHSLYHSPEICDHDFSEQLKYEMVDCLANSLKCNAKMKIIGLTAGKDSLALASLISSRNVLGASFGKVGCDDVVQGEAIANHLAIPYRIVSLCNEEEFEKYASWIAYFSGGTATCSYADMCKMMHLLTVKNAVFIMGEGGECIRDFFGDEHQLQKALINYYTPPGIFLKTLNPDYKEAIKSYPNNLFELVTPAFRDKPFNQQNIDFYRYSRMQGNFSQRSSILNVFGDKLSPFLDSEFSRLTFPLKTAYYKNSFLHREIIKVVNPLLLKFFDNPLRANTDSQDWCSRFSQQTGELVYNLFESNLPDKGDYFNKKEVLNTCKENMVRPDKRSIFFLLRLLSFTLYNSQNKLKYFHKLEAFPV